MEFHRTSMELQKRSMEFHGVFLGNLKVPWNSMEFHGTWGAPISLTRTVLWNSMELRVRQFRWHEQFHGIPWNLNSSNFADTSGSMEFHGIPWNLGCANFADTSSSMEFHYHYLKLGWIMNVTPRLNDRRFADGASKCILLNKKLWISNKISLNLVHKCPINNYPALFQTMAWRRPGDNPFSEPMLVGSLTHICVTRPQWLNDAFICYQVSVGLRLSHKGSWLR